MNSTATAAGLALGLALVPSLAAAQVGSRIDPLPADALAALAPLAQRGAAALVLDPDGGARARVTVAVPVRADLDTTRRALVEAEGWPTFMPALGGVASLSRHGRRAAWRMTVRAGLLDVHAVTQVHEVSARRVDFSITESDFGSAAARWDLHPTADGSTLVMTAWCDPSEGHWLLRRAAGSNPTATAGINVAIGLVLARAVQQQAERRTAATAPPPAASAPALPTPEPGPWDDLSARWYVLSFAFPADGSAVQVSATARTRASAARVQSRLDAVPEWPRFLPALREAEPVDPQGARLRLHSPFDEAEGTVQRSTPSAGVTLWQGSDPALADSAWRWDLRTAREGDTLVTLTGRVDRRLSATLPRAAAAREPLLYVGLTGLRHLLWMRGLLAGLAPG